MWQSFRYSCVCALLLMAVLTHGANHLLPPHKGHAGMNRRDHHFTLHEVWSDEWMGKCAYGIQANITDDMLTEVDLRATTTAASSAAAAVESKRRGEARSAGGKDLPLPLPFNPRAGDSRGLKVLLVSVDNRALMTQRYPARDPESLRARGAFASLSAAINEDYAREHGYDYLFVTLNSTKLYAQLKPRYNCTFDDIEVKSIHNFKYGPSSFHPRYQYLRASSWNKIPPLYHLSYEYGHLYDWIMYLDSDVTLNPLYRNRSVSHMLDEYQHGKSNKFGVDVLPNNSSYVQWGQTNLSKTNMLFLSNFPWRDGVYMCVYVYV